MSVVMSGIDMPKDCAFCRYADLYCHKKFWYCKKIGIFRIYHSGELEERPLDCPRFVKQKKSIQQDGYDYGTDESLDDIELDLAKWLSEKPEGYEILL